MSGILRLRDVNTLDFERAYFNEASVFKSNNNLAHFVSEWYVGLSVTVSVFELQFLDKKKAGRGEIEITKTESLNISDLKTEYKKGKWYCSCHFFSQWGLCSHTMALQQVLGNMLSKEALSTAPDVNP